MKECNEGKKYNNVGIIFNKPIVIINLFQIVMVYYLLCISSWVDLHYSPGHYENRLETQN